MISNKKFIRTKKFVDFSKEEFEEFPFNTWKTCVILIGRKYGAGTDYSDQKWSFEIIDLKHGTLRIYLCHENPKIGLVKQESA